VTCRSAPNKMRPLITRLVICVLACVVLGSVVTATGCRSKYKRYALHGQVVRKNAEANQITIKADEIPGFMAAMTMPYKVHDPAEPQKVEPGDVISADVVTTSDGKDYWLENIKVLDSSGRKR